MRIERGNQNWTSQTSLLHMLPLAIMNVEGCVQHKRLKYTQNMTWRVVSNLGFQSKRQSAGDAILGNPWIKYSPI